MLEAGRVVWRGVKWKRLAVLLAALWLIAWLVTPPRSAVRMEGGAITLRNGKGVEVHLLR